MNATKALFVLLVLIAGTVIILITGGDEPEPAPVIENPVATPQPEQPAAEPIQAETPTVSPVARERVDEGTTLPDHADRRQGVRGQIVDPAGRPLPGHMVYLMESTGRNMMRHMTLAQNGTIIPPLAGCETDDDGRFALGLTQSTAAQKYEVRVVSEMFVDHKIPNITVRGGEWYDAGVIRLKRGAVLYGRVTVKASSGIAIPDATVSVEAMNPFPSLTPTPGREQGLTAQVDASGAYRMENVPTGMVTVSAVAPGYARISKPNIRIQQTPANELSIELPPGVAIAGTVADEAGNPIAGARIEAFSLTSKAGLQNTTRSLDDGSFEVIGLLRGRYMLTALAPGYVRTEVKPVRTGERAAEIRMEKQGSARVKVFDKDGRLLKRYHAAVKQYYEAEQQMGTTVKGRTLAKTGRDGIFEVSGLNAGTYVFEVYAKGHAKSFSPSFTVELGQDAPLVEMTLNTGGTIRGTVVDAQNQPISGVAVQTLSNEFGDTPFANLFPGLLPNKITLSSKKTNARGEFELDLLNPGAYKLKFSHPEHFDVKQKDIEVAVGQTVELGSLTMHPGTAVSGRARVDGKPTAQIKISITTLLEKNVVDQAGFNAEAISDQDGNFVVDKRMPPGRYQVMASRQTLENPILALGDMHKTKQEFTLGAGQKTYFIEVNVPSR